MKQFILIIVICLGLTGCATYDGAPYNNGLTRSIADTLYCKINGHCTLSSLNVTGNASIGSLDIYENATDIVFLGNGKNITIPSLNVSAGGGGSGSNCDDGSCVNVTYMNRSNKGYVLADEFRVDATNDIVINQTNDDLYITNKNNQKKIYFVLNRSGEWTPLRLDASSGRVVYTTFNKTYGSEGFLNIGGNFQAASLSALSAYSPTVTGSGFLVANLFQPQMQDPVTAIAFLVNPGVGNNDQLIETIRTTAADHKPGYNDNIKIITSSETRSFFGFGGSTDASNVTYQQIDLGGEITVGDFGGAVSLPNVNETMIKLTGGGTKVGTLGSINQKGIEFTGFGTQSGLVAGTDSVRAITSDGGIVEWKHDMSSTSYMSFGAGDDVKVGFDGTNFIINTTITNPDALLYTYNISATDYITRTDAWDKKNYGSALDHVKPGHEIRDAKNKINHDNFDEHDKVKYSVRKQVGTKTVIKKEIINTIEIPKNVKDLLIYQNQLNSTHSEIGYEAEEPVYEIVEETGVSLGKLTAKHEEAIYELKEQNKDLTSMIAQLKYEIDLMKQGSGCQSYLYG